MITYDDQWEQDGFDATEYRPEEYELVNDVNGRAIGVFDLRYNTRLESGLAIGRTCFICVVLAGGALMFQRDTDNLVINPISNMLEKVKKIAKNPLEAA